jgi:hypothetical protein
LLSNLSFSLSLQTHLNINIDLFGYISSHDKHKKLSSKDDNILIKGTTKPFNNKKKKKKEEIYCMIFFFFIDKMINENEKDLIKILI